MSGQGLEMRHYYRAIAKRLWLVLLLMVLIAGGVYWRTGAEPPQYVATTTLLVTAHVVQPPASMTGAQQNAGGTSRGNQTLIRDIVTLLQTRPIAERVTGVLSLPAGDFRRGVKIEEVRGTNLIKVRATANDRNLPARLANTTAEQFVTYYRNVNRRDMREMRTFLGNELARTRAELDASDRLIQAYKERYRFVDLSVLVGQVSEDLASLRRDRQTTAILLKETEARLAAATARFNREALTRVTERSTENNSVFQQLQSRLTALELQRTELSQKYTPLHPRMQELKGELAEVKRQLMSQARYVLGKEVTGINPVHEQLLTQIAALQVDRAAMAARPRALTVEEQSRQANLLPLARQQRELGALLRDNLALTLNYSALAQLFQDARLRENEAGFVPAGVQVVEAAVTPAAPEAAGLPVRVGVGALVGLLLGLMAAIVLETSDDRIRSPREAERVLGVPVLAEVPDMAPPRVAPAGAAVVIGLIFTLLIGTSIVVARTTSESTFGSTGAPVSMLVRLGRGIDGFAAWVGQAAR